MTYLEQHKIVVELEDHTHRMKGPDAYDFEMLRKRDKDEEELDSISQKRLQALYETYVIKRRRNL